MHKFFKVFYAEINSFLGLEYFYDVYYLFFEISSSFKKIEKLYCLKYF